MGHKSKDYTNSAKKKRDDEEFSNIRNESSPEITFVQMKSRVPIIFIIIL